MHVKYPSKIDDILNWMNSFVPNLSESGANECILRALNITIKAPYLKFIFLIYNPSFMNLMHIMLNTILL